MCTLFSAQNLPTSDPVTTALLNAAAKGSQSVVQHLVKRFANVKDKVGMEVITDSGEIWGLNGNGKGKWGVGWKSTACMVFGMECWINWKYIGMRIS